MIKHLFKLIWKKKKSNFLLMLEIFFSFLIFFAVWSLGLYFYKNYKQPDGSNIDRVWAVFCQFDSDTMRSQKKELVSQKLKSYAQVESFAFSSNNVPYSFSSSNTDIKYNGNAVQSEIMHWGPAMKEVLDIKLKEGKWFNEGDRINKYPVFVINATLKEKLFGQEQAVGKVVGEKEEDKKQIIGVVDNFKYESNYDKVTPCMISLEEVWSSVCLVKVRPGTDLAFEAKLTKELAGLGSGWSIEVQHMDNMKHNQNNIVLIPLLILFIVSGFLIFNVALGLFGVLFQTISRRKGEIGLRRAVGATRSNILWQFVDESIVIATLALILGLFFAVQFPLLHVFDVESSTYLLGMVFAVISIFLLVILCALLPSRQAASILTAAALHEE